MSVVDRARGYLRTHTSEENRNVFLRTENDMAKVLYAKVKELCELNTAGPDWLQRLSDLVYTVVFEWPKTIDDISWFMHLHEFKDDDHLCNTLAALFIVYPEKFEGDI